MRGKDPRTRIYHIAALSICFFVSGLIFFLIRMGVNLSNNSDAEAIPQTFHQGEAVYESSSFFSKMPAPDFFRSFKYSSFDETLRIEGLCKDRYRVILIYAASVDYRENTLEAKYNTAVPCVASSGSFREDIFLHTLSLVPKEKYYIIRAHQGKEGTWYDPY